MSTPNSVFPSLRRYFTSSYAIKRGSEQVTELRLAPVVLRFFVTNLHFNEPSKSNLLRQELLRAAEGNHLPKMGRGKMTGFS